MRATGTGAAEQFKAAGCVVEELEAAPSFAETQASFWRLLAIEGRAGIEKHVKSGLRPSVRRPANFSKKA